MAYPTKPTVPVVPPAPSRLSPGADFVSKADAMMAYLPVQVQNNAETVDFNAAAVEACLATAMMGTLPSLTGHAGNFPVVNAGATAVEFQTPATARTALLAGTALQGIDSAHGSTVFLGSNNNWNFAVGASETSDARFWTNSGVSNGITWTKTASGVDDNGEGWATYSLSGTAINAASVAFGYEQNQSIKAALIGEVYTASVKVSVSGSQAGNGVRMGVSPGSGVFTNGNNVVLGAVDQISTVSHTMVANDTLRCRVSIGVNAGAAVNATVTIRGLQFERGSVRTAGRYKEMTTPEARAALGLGAHAVPVGLTGLSAVTIPNISPWARSITVSLNDVRTNTNGVIKFLRAVTGVSTVATTGYAAGAAFGPATGEFSNNQTGFPLSAPNNSLAVHDLSGSVTLTLHDAATNTWVLSGSLHSLNYGVGCFASGIVALPGPLTGIQILVGSGGTSFSQGSIAARWEA